MRYLLILSLLYLTAGCDTGPDSDYPRLAPKSTLLGDAPPQEDPTDAVLARAAALNARAARLRERDS